MPSSDKKTWKEAKETCETQGMRLPKYEELAFAIQSGQVKKWSNMGTIFWVGNANEALSQKLESVLYTQDSRLIFSCVENSFSLKEGQAPKGSYLFSTYQGSMIWDKADKKCKSIGMRLPTIDELKEAYKSEITKSWQKNGYDYWSSTPYDAERYYKLSVYNGTTYNYHRNVNDNVRCRR